MLPGDGDIRRAYALPECDILQNKSFRERDRGVGGKGEPLFQKGLSLPPDFITSPLLPDDIRQEAIMRAVFLLLSLVLTAALLAGCESPLGGARMAYVDVAVILEKSRAAEEAEAHLKKVREVLQKGYDELAVSLSAKPEKERQAELARGMALLQRQLAIEKEAARQIVLKAMNTACGEWHKAYPDSWLVTRESVLAAPADKDVTQDILARMKSVEVAFPDLPVVTIREPVREEAKSQTPGSGSSSGTQAGKRR